MGHHKNAYQVCMLRKRIGTASRPTTPQDAACRTLCGRTCMFRWAKSAQAILRRLRCFPRGTEVLGRRVASARVMSPLRTFLARSEHFLSSAIAVAIARGETPEAAGAAHVGYVDGCDAGWDAVGSFARHSAACSGLPQAS